MSIFMSIRMSTHMSIHDVLGSGALVPYIRIDSSDPLIDAIPCTDMRTDMHTDMHTDMCSTHPSGMYGARIGRNVRRHGLEGMYGARIGRLSSRRPT